MSFHVLKATAIEILDRAAENISLWVEYGRSLDDDTKLDDIGITVEVRGQLALPTNEAFSQFPNWMNLSAPEIEACETIGDYIELVARQAQVPMVGDPK